MIARPSRSIRNRARRAGFGSNTRAASRKLSSLASTVALGPDWIVFLGILQLLVQRFQPRFQRGDLFLPQVSICAASDGATAHRRSHRPDRVRSASHPAPAFGRKRPRIVSGVRRQTAAANRAIVRRDRCPARRSRTSRPPSRFVCLSADKRAEAVVRRDRPHRKARCARSPHEVMGFCRLTKPRSWVAWSSLIENARATSD